jgi:hypothetical protein
MAHSDVLDTLNTIFILVSQGPLFSVMLQMKSIIVIISTSTIDQATFNQTPEISHIALLCSVLLIHHDAAT